MKKRGTRCTLPIHSTMNNHASYRRRNSKESHSKLTGDIRCVRPVSVRFCYSCRALAAEGLSSRRASAHGEPKSQLSHAIDVARLKHKSNANGGGGIQADHNVIKQKRVEGIVGGTVNTVCDSTPEQNKKKRQGLTSSSHEHSILWVTPTYGKQHIHMHAYTPVHPRQCNLQWFGQGGRKPATKKKRTKRSNEH